MSNIKHILALASAAILSVALASCSADPEVEDFDVPSGAILRLSTGSSFTRSDHFDDDEYAELNEELIDRVDLFFFSNDSKDSAPFYSCELTNLRETTVADLSVKIPVELTSNFINNKGYVYALVNLPSQIAVDTSKNSINGTVATLSAIEQVWVNAPEFLAAVQTSFVMRGGATVELDGNGRNAVVTGYIALERLASKIRLWADIPDEIFVDKTTGKTLYQGDDESDDNWETRKRGENVECWVPVPQDVDGNSSMKLYLYNLTTRGRIDGYTGTADLGYENIDRRRDYESIVRSLSKDARLNAADKDSQYEYSHSTAYYSYPNYWDSTTPTEEHKTYVILSLPWKNTTDPDSQEWEVYYYQIPVNVLRDTDKDDADRLDPNRYYRIKLHVGMLGSKDLGSPLEIDSSCEVVDWVSAPVDVNIHERRYLVVNQKKWVMNNVWTLEIPFSTSHKTVVTDCFVTYFRYNDIWGTDTNSDGTHAMNEFENWLESAKGLPNGQAGEGLITASFGTKQIRTQTNNSRTREETYTTTYNHTNEQLYYKSEYFNDPYIGYKYYVGHEHPITFKKDFVKFKEHKDMTAAEKEAWNDYNLKYDSINAVYTCTIDDENSVINFRHPLIQWKGVSQDVVTKDTGLQSTGDYWTGRGLSRRHVYQYSQTTEYTSTFKYYVPELNPRTGSLWDEFSRIDIVIKIKHEDWDSEKDGLYEETIYVTQYPGMYIEVSHNYGSPGNSGNQYVRVNNYHDTNGGYWNQVNRLTNFSENESNVNPNMYLIHTTQLSEENEKLYEIGDPRTLYYNNNLGTAQDKDKNSNNDKNTSGHGYDVPLTDSGNTDADKKDDGSYHWSGYNHGVTYSGTNNSAPDYDNNLSENGSIYNSASTKTLYSYYPADESTGAGSKENFIAPVFRIASSFGRVNVNGRTEMRRRCAAYQEAGRPAGRWRLPTKAEVKYIAQLSADNKIPILFGSVSSKLAFGFYWTAQGGMTVNGDGECYDEEYGDLSEGVNNYPAGIMAARCVYDEWYWTEVDGGEFPSDKDFAAKAQTTTFKWGDKKKDNTQTQAIMQKALNKKGVFAKDE